MNYAVIDTGDSKVYQVSQYTASDFSIYAADYAAANPGFQLIDLGNSTFPEGQSWVIQLNGSKVPPTTVGYSTVQQVRNNIILNILTRSDVLEYANSVSYNNLIFSNTQNKRNSLGFLLAFVNSGNLSLFPAQMVALDGTILELTTVAELQDFVSNFISNSTVVHDSEIAQIKIIDSYAKMSQLLLYVDQR